MFPSQYCCLDPGLTFPPLSTRFLPSSPCSMLISWQLVLKTNPLYMIFSKFQLDECRLLPAQSAILLRVDHQWPCVAFLLLISQTWSHKSYPLSSTLKSYFCSIISTCQPSYSPEVLSHFFVPWMFPVLGTLSPQIPNGSFPHFPGIFLQVIP